MHGSAARSADAVRDNAPSRSDTGAHRKHWRNFELGMRLDQGFTAQPQRRLPFGGGYTAHILKGENPSELPVQQTTKIEMYINLESARAPALQAYRRDDRLNNDVRFGHALCRI
jgi:hypothetical protein